MPRNFVRGLSDVALRSTLQNVVGSPKAGLSKAVATGMRRVSWVRIVLDDSGAHCSLIGVGHRLPNVRPVSLDTALALAASGVPTVVRSADGASEKLLVTG